MSLLRFSMRPAEKENIQYLSELEGFCETPAKSIFTGHVSIPNLKIYLKLAS